MNVCVWSGPSWQAKLVNFLWDIFFIRVNPSIPVMKWEQDDDNVFEDSSFAKILVWNHLTAGQCEGYHARLTTEGFGVQILNPRSPAWEQIWNNWITIFLVNSNTQKFT